MRKFWGKMCDFGKLRFFILFIKNQVVIIAIYFIVNTSIDIVLELNLFLASEFVIKSMHNNFNVICMENKVHNLLDFVVYIIYTPDLKSRAWLMQLLIEKPPWCSG